jgi:hypothetical protein
MDSLRVLDHLRQAGQLSVMERLALCKPRIPLQQICVAQHGSILEPQLTVHP